MSRLTIATRLNEGGKLLVGDGKPRHMNRLIKSVLRWFQRKVLPNFPLNRTATYGILTRLQDDPGRGFLNPRLGIAEISGNSWVTQSAQGECQFPPVPDRRPGPDRRDTKLAEFFIRLFARAVTVSF